MQFKRESWESQFLGEFSNIWESIIFLLDFALKALFLQTLLHVFNFAMSDWSL